MNAFSETSKQPRLLHALNLCMQDTSTSLCISPCLWSVMHRILKQVQCPCEAERCPSQAATLAWLQVNYQTRVLTAIHLCRKVFPQPKLRDRSLPVPRGMTATAGGGSSWSSRIVFSIQDTVPSPPAAKMRSRLHRHAIQIWHDV